MTMLIDLVNNSILWEDVGRGGKVMERCLVCFGAAEDEVCERWWCQEELTFRLRREDHIRDIIETGRMHTCVECHIVILAPGYIYCTSCSTFDR